MGRYEDFFDERGISARIRDARPYVPYTKENREPVRQEYSTLPGSVRGFMLRMALKSDGFLIMRHAPPGLGLGHVYAEFKPYDDVETKPPTVHFHPTIPSPAPINPKTGRPYPMLTGKAKLAHIESHDDHKGMNNEEVHSHVNAGKYLFCPNSKVPEEWSHDHDEQYEGKPEKRAAHLARYHEGEDVSGRHSHVKMVKDRRNGLARRIDIHPLALPLFENASRVFLGIEGCPKADAMLEQGEAAASCPAVGQWNAPELKAFALRYLVGKTVIIVPDADWFKNWQVEDQALMLRSFLHRLGIEAHIAAPPYRLGLKGFDDFHAADYSVDEMEVIGKEMSLGFMEWASRLPGRKERRRRNIEVAQCLALHAKDNGEIQKGVRSIARILDTHPSRVSDALKDVLSMDEFHIDKPLSTQRGVWRTNTYFDPSLDWVDRPTITIAPELRAVRTAPVTLGEVTYAPPQAGEHRYLLIDRLPDYQRLGLEELAKFAQRMNKSVGSRLRP